MPSKLLRSVMVLLIALPISASAFEERLTSGEMLGASFLDTVSIPTPGEFFLALGKQCQPNWSKLIRTSSPVSTVDRERIAVQLGILTADGFMAIEAQDGQSVKNSARDILLLAKKLNAGQQIVARSQCISDFADSGKWSRLREEFDAMQNDIRLCLLEQKDSPLVVLSMAGSWVRQIDLGSNLVAGSESPYSSALLIQPEIASRLLSRLENLPESVRQRPIVRQLKDGLHTSHELMLRASSTLPASDVQTLANTMSEITGAAGQQEPKP